MLKLNTHHAAGRRPAGSGLLFALAAIGALLVVFVLTSRPARASLLFQTGDVLVADGAVNTVTLLQMGNLVDGVPQQQLISADPQFQQLSGLAVDGADEIFVTDLVNHALYQVDAGSGVATQMATDYFFAAPASLAFDALPEDAGGNAAGSLLVTDTASNTITRFALPLTPASTPIAIYLNPVFGPVYQAAPACNGDLFASHGVRVSHLAAPGYSFTEVPPSDGAISLQSVRGIGILGEGSLLFGQAATPGRDGSLVLMGPYGSQATVLGPNAFPADMQPNPTFLTVTGTNQVGFGATAIVSSGEVVYAVSNLSLATPGDATATVLANNFIAAAQSAYVPAPGVFGVVGFDGGGDLLVQENCGTVSQPWATNIVPADGSVNFTVTPGASTGDLEFASLPFVASDGTLTFTPRENTSGSAWFHVTAESGGVTGGAANFRITVNAPPYLGDNAFYYLPENAGYTPLNLLEPFDLELSPLAVLVTSVPDPSLGSVYTVDHTPLSEGFNLLPQQVSQLQFRPTPDAIGFGGILEYLVIDPQGGISFRIVTFTVNGPYGSSYALSVGENTTNNPLNILDPRNSDFNVAEGMVVTIDAVPAAFQGVINGPGNLQVSRTSMLSQHDLGHLTFTPAHNFEGDAGAFAYTLTDLNGGKRSQTITLTVAGAPPGVNLVLVVAENSGPTPLGIPSPESSNPNVTIQAITVTTVPDASKGNVYAADGATVIQTGNMLSAADVTGLQFQPVPNASGDAGKLKFTVAYSTGSVTQNCVTLFIDAPPTVDPTKVLHVAAGSVANPLGIHAPTDPEGDSSLLVTLDGLPDPSVGFVALAGGSVLQAGSLVTVGDLAGLTFTPQPGYHGFDLALAYTVADSFQPTPQTASQVIFILVELPPSVDTTTNVNVPRFSPPTPLGLQVPFELDQDYLNPDSVTIAVTIQQVPDPAKGYLALYGSPVTPSSVLSPADIANLTFQPEGGAAGEAGSFQYTAINDTGGYAVQSINFLITSSPIVSGATYVVVGGTTSPSSLRQNDPADPDGEAVHVTVNSVPNPTQGTVQTADGSPVGAGATLSVTDVSGLAFLPAPGFTGNPGSLQYTAMDPSGNSTSQTVAICVVGISAGPTVSGITATGATVTWTTNVAGGSTVNYGTVASGIYASTATGSAGVTTHTVTLTGLTPGTAYQLMALSQFPIPGLSDVSVSSAPRTFTTLSPDSTPPLWGVPTPGTNSSGQAIATVTVRDTGSGLASISVISSGNCVLTWPSFTPGTTSSVTVTATKINQSLKASFALQAVDVAGNSSALDPVVAQITIPRGEKTVTRTYKNLPAEEHFLSLSNGTPGLTRFSVRVNGGPARVFSLTDGQQLAVDLGAEMQRKNNQVTVTGRGPARGSAALLISDSAGGAASGSASNRGGAHWIW